jgi:uncharacterized membrane protein
MSTPASIRGHPLHPMLVTIPIGLWVFSFACDIASYSTANPLWTLMAFYTLAAGEVGALAAAIPGLIDFVSLRSPRARKIAAAHMALNLTIVTLVAVNLWWRWTAEVETVGPYALSGLTIVLLIVSGWLGGELVHVLGVTVGETSGVASENERVARPVPPPPTPQPTPRPR